MTHGWPVWQSTSLILMTALGARGIHASPTRGAISMAPSYAAAADEAADVSCVPGCKPLGQGWCSGDTGLCNVQCSMGGHCPWAPSSLKGMLTQHEAIVDPDGARPYNELIIDPKAWRTTLPAGLEGVFFYGAADSESAAYARSVRDTFASEFGLSAAQQPPLMQMDMWARPSSPFALVL